MTRRGLFATFAAVIVTRKLPRKSDFPRVLADVVNRQISAATALTLDRPSEVGQYYAQISWKAVLNDDLAVLKACNHLHQPLGNGRDLG